jgi:hypothetical protein
VSWARNLSLGILSAALARVDAIGPCGLDLVAWFSGAPALTRTFTARHAAHHPGCESRPASDLTTWVVRNQAPPTRAQLDQLGVPPAAEYHSGTIARRSGARLWHYTISTPAAPGSTCERCAS